MPRGEQGVGKHGVQLQTTLRHGQVYKHGDPGMGHVAKQQALSPFSRPGQQG